MFSLHEYSPTSISRTYKQSELSSQHKSSTAVSPRFLSLSHRSQREQNIRVTLQCRPPCQAGHITFSDIMYNSIGCSWDLAQGCERCSCKTKLCALHVLHCHIQKALLQLSCLTLSRGHILFLIWQTTMLVGALDTAHVREKRVKWLRLDILPRALQNGSRKPDQQGWYQSFY